jgi:hypothetical protein
MAAANPVPKPNPMKRNNMTSTLDDFSTCATLGGAGEKLHGLDNGGPHSPRLPSNELFWNVEN